MGIPLCISFPSLVVSKEVWVRDNWGNHEEGEGWNPLFSRSFNDWEMEEAKRLLRRLGQYVVHDDSKDNVCWELTRDGVFLVRSMYLVLQWGPTVLFPWHIIWKSSVQSKISFSLGSGLGKDFDARSTLEEGYGSSLANRCNLCMEGEEYVAHLLLHYAKTRILWVLLFSLFDIR